MLKGLIQRAGRAIALAMTLAYVFGLLAPSLAMAAGGASATSHCMFDVSDITANASGKHDMSAHPALFGTDTPAHTPSKIKPHDCCGPACLTALPPSALAMPARLTVHATTDSRVVTPLTSQNPKRPHKPPIASLSL